MEEITKTNTTRILKFLQAFKLDFSNYSVWNYSRKKFHDEANTQSQVDNAIEFLEENGFIEKVRRPGYYRLTVRGENFESWDMENIQETLSEEALPNLNKWRQMLLFNKKEKKEAKELID
jgi:DNA-binding PadR family transcriptional regulator